MLHQPTIEREPPLNIELEQAVLGAILLDNAVLQRVSLGAADFYDPLHAAIFAHVEADIAAGRVASPVSIKPVFEDFPLITDDLTVPQYLTRLVGAAATAHSLKSYVAGLRELANRRALVAAAAELDTTARIVTVKIEDAAGMAVQALDTVLSMARPGKRTRSDFNGAVSDFLDSLLNDDGSARITTGLVDLDKVLGGWRRQQFAIVAGRPSMGKTALATSLMLKTARAGVGVLYFSLEMPATALAARCLSDLAYGQDTRIAYSDALAGKLQEREIAILGKVAGTYAQLPLVIDDQRGLTMAELAARTRAEAQRMKTNGVDLGLVVVDHLGLIKPSGRYAGNKVLETGEVSDALATLAKEQNVALVALHQLNRGTEGRENKRPTLADLRNSGDLEQDADVVCFAYREAYYLERNKSDAGSQQELQRRTELDACKNTMEVLVAKNRNGATSTVNLFCDMASNALRDLA